jgi:hypothetical protein
MKLRSLFLGVHEKALEECISDLTSPEFRHTYEEHPGFLSVSW